MAWPKNPWPEHLLKYLGFEPQKEFPYAISRVFRARDAEGIKIVKLSDSYDNHRPLMRESRVLERMGDLEGLPHSLEFYERIPERVRFGIFGSYCLGKRRIMELFTEEKKDLDEPGVLVKEYIYGTPIGWRRPDGSEALLRPSNEAFLETLVRNLHKEGIANLDLGRAQNVLITPNGRPALFDFGSAVLVGECSFPYFVRVCSRDLRKLEELFKLNYRLRLK